MFTINIKFLDSPPKALYSRMSLDEIYGYLLWEADLTVTYNNQMLFSEEVAIIEFYWYLVNWYRRYIIGIADQFVYSTVEHSKPILVFSPRQNQYWEINSVWKQCDKSALVKEEILRSEVHKLLEEMMVAIEY